MGQRLGDLLAAGRGHVVVGRDAELGLAEEVIGAARLPFHVLWVHGPGGIGKTALLRQTAEIAARHAVRSFWIDGFAAAPTPASFLAALGRLVAPARGVSPIQALAELDGRSLIVLDDYDAVAGLDDWLRQDLLPQIPADTLVAIASREAPPRTWLADPGWRTVVRQVPLGPVDPADGRSYLRSRSIAADRVDEAVAISNGYPLWLALIADTLAARPDTGLPAVPVGEPRASLADLVFSLEATAPDAEHRIALYASAVVHTLREPLLADLLGVGQARESFAWLSGLSCYDAHGDAIVLHRDVRRALIERLRADEAEQYRTLYLRARTDLLRRFGDHGAGSRESVVGEYAFLHRDHPVLTPYGVFGREFRSEGLTTSWVEPSDGPILRAMVARHEGEQSARLFEHWLDCQPRGALVVRDSHHRPAGFLMTIALDQADDDDLSADPGARQVLSHVRSAAPLHVGHAVLLFRFWMAADTYQELSPIQNLLFIAMLSQLSAVAPLAFNGIVCSDADRWVALLGLGGSTRLADADFDVGDRRYGVYGRDWRMPSVPGWAPAGSSRRSVDDGLDPALDLTPPAPAVRPLARPPMLALSTPTAPPPESPVLSDAQFGAAVRDALRHYSFPDSLRRSPLLHARIVSDRVGVDARTEDRVSALRAIVEEVVEAMRTAPRLARCYRALYHTYLEPSESQERVAERLDLPFGTYRGHLRAGIDRVTDALLQRERG